MRIHSIKEPLAGMVVLSGLIFAILLTTAEPARAGSADPSEADPGATVTVSGSVDLGLLQPRVRMCWDSTSCGGATYPVNLLTGAYSVTLTVPDLEPGGHTINACPTTVGSCDSTSITVLDPTPPPPPTTTTTTRPTTTTTTRPPTTTTTVAPTTTVTNAPTTTNPAPTTTPTNPTTTPPNPGTTPTSPTNPGANPTNPTNPTNPGTTQPGTTTESPGTTYEPPSTTNPGGSSTSENEESEDEVLGVTIENDDPENGTTEDGTQEGRALSPLAAQPTTTYTPPSIPSKAEGSDLDTTDRTVAEAQADTEALLAGESSSPWTFDKPIVYWAVWVLLMIVVLGVATALNWGMGLRRRRQDGPD